MRADDLTAETLKPLLPGRPLRSYPALLSTEADALAWARSGAPEGAGVVADYQASPRGRSGLEWQVTPGASLGFSLILRPDLPPEREGWLYTVASCALAGVLGESARIQWPDDIRLGGASAGVVGAQVGLGPERIDWAVVNVLVRETSRPRGPLLARVLEAIEARLHQPSEDLLGEHRSRCETIGRTVRARMIPMGPTGVVIEGKATGTKSDGALVIETARGTHIAARPQNLGLLEEIDHAGPSGYPQAVEDYLARGPSDP